MAESAAYAVRTFLGGAALARIPGGLNAGVTGVIACDDLSSWVGATANGPTRVMINRQGATPEEIEITDVSGNNITIPAGGRGLEGTDDTSHGANATIEIVMSPRDLREANHWVAELAAAVSAANIIPVSDADNSLTGLSVAASRIVGRAAAGDVAALTVAQVKTLLALAINDLSDVDTSSVAPTDGQALVWDDGDSLWVPGTVASGTSLTSATATVSTNESTTSASYTDLATPGPAVTLTTGTKALVIVTCRMRNSTNTGQTYMGYAVSGASTVAASDARALSLIQPAGDNSTYMEASRVILHTGLTAGSNTFTSKFTVGGGGGTGDFNRRDITVIDMGS